VPHHTIHKEQSHGKYRKKEKMFLRDKPFVQHRDRIKETSIRVNATCLDVRHALFLKSYLTGSTSMGEQKNFIM